MRKKKIIKGHPVKPDRKFSSPIVGKLINKVMKRGEKRKATQIVYQAAEIVEKKTSAAFLTILEKALGNIKPAIEMKRRSGLKGRFPKAIDEVRSMKIALRWLVESAKTKKTPYRMYEKLAEEINSAYNKSGEAFKKKETLYKEAESSGLFTPNFEPPKKN
ncbi:MAG: 30S ribosomal protein S7 [Candidatus Moeniiplasma glomeromycotorum]|nr:30S ribosomal protein S7 [Candidatus Moeniiplasma glomeromycotorum]MCE8169376.1 30S ribosomal protein S7 [Candidatus Moeniiplasma glomeromycotorum]